MNHKPEQNTHLHIHKVKINFIINVLAFLHSPVLFPSVQVFAQCLVIYAFSPSLNRLFPHSVSFNVWGTIFIPRIHVRS